MDLISSRNFLIRVGRVLCRKLKLNINNDIINDLCSTTPILNEEQSNSLIVDVINREKPFMLSRFGTPESRFVLNYLQQKAVKENYGIKKIQALMQGNIDYWRQSVKNDLQNLVGFFPTSDDMLWRFGEFYTEQIRKMDAIGIWGFVPGESYLINLYCSYALQYNPTALEPYFFKNPWSAQLKNKKVLVIHPFIESIIFQYSRREMLFPGTDVLPQFELKTIKAVQSIAGNKTEYADWFEALQSMFQKIDEIEFDIAIIGAGSYGLPLSAYVKNKGKIAIHIGGATQILFGIKGKRWDNHSVISKFYNKYWVRPSQNEVVPQANKVENGCYW